MLREFIDFVDSVLPSVDAETKDKAKAAIEQFQVTGNQIEYIAPNILPELSQGDIVSDMIFSYFKEDGSQHIYKAKGLVISTSCHIDQGDKLNIVPVRLLEDYEVNPQFVAELKKNKIFSLMYLPENLLEDYVVDFSGVSTYDKKLIMDGLERGKLHRICSLSQIGLYFFVIKLTVFLMRKEDIDTLKFRSC